MKHLMLDIETMDIAPTAAVIAIGARLFEDGVLGKGFELFIDQGYACQFGTVSDSTMAWWREQEHREEVFNGRLHPADAAVAFSNFVHEHKPDTVWANSPSFDCVILRHMFKQVGVKWPFHYRDERDCRTIFALQRELNIDCEDLWTNPDRRGHVPLDDATTQAQVVARVLGVVTIGTQMTRATLTHPAEPEIVLVPNQDIIELEQPPSDVKHWGPAPEVSNPEVLASPDSGPVQLALELPEPSAAATDAATAP